MPYRGRSRWRAARVRCRRRRRAPAPAARWSRPAGRAGRRRWTRLGRSPGSSTMSDRSPGSPSSSASSPSARRLSARASTVRGRPDVARAPLVGARHPVADRGALEDAGVLILQPVVEPGERLDVEALPRPRQPELAEHPDPDDRCVGQRPHGRERGGQVKRDVLPVAAEIGGHLNAVQQRHQVPLIPPLVAQRVLDRHRPPQVVPRVRIVVQLERGVQDGDRRLSVHRGELAVQRSRAQDVPGGVDQRAAPEPVTARGREPHHREERRHEARS